MSASDPGLSARHDLLGSHPKQSAPLAQKATRMRAAVQLPIDPINVRAASSPGLTGRDSTSHFYGVPIGGPGGMLSTFGKRLSLANPPMHRGNA
jgi:hypothetical protein